MRLARIIQRAVLLACLLLLPLGARADESLKALFHTLTTKPDRLTEEQWDALAEAGTAIDPLMTAYVDRDEANETEAELVLYDWLNEQYIMERPWPTFLVAALERQADRTDWKHSPSHWLVSLMVRIANPHIVPILIDRVRETIVNWQPDTSVPIQSDEEMRVRFRRELHLLWNVQDLTDFGPATKALGPDLVALLHQPLQANLRAVVVQALGAMEYKPALPVLIDQIPHMQHDFMLAYYLLETLARLDKASHLDLFRQTARSYWYAPVRMQAKRALLYEPGQPFRLNLVPDDYRSNYDLPAASNSLEYDMEVGDRLCEVDWAWPYPQLDDGEHEVLVGWPPLENFPLWLDIEKLSDEQRATIAASLPDYFKRHYGRARFVARFHGWEILGLDHGEFGGGVVARPQGAGKEVEPTVLWDENAKMVVYTDDRLFVLAGLSHLSLSFGSLLIIEKGEDGPVVATSIRLPRAAYSLALMGPDKLFVAFENTDMVVRADGTMLDVRHMDDCAGPPKEWLKDKGKE